MPRGATAHELGDRLLQIYDEIKAYPLREQHGYGGLGAREPRAARDGRRDGRRVLFISALDGGCGVRSSACSTSMGTCCLVGRFPEEKSKCRVRANGSRSSYVCIDRLPGSSGSG